MHRRQNAAREKCIQTVILQPCVYHKTRTPLRLMPAVVGTPTFDNTKGTTTYNNELLLRLASRPQAHTHKKRSVNTLSAICSRYKGSARECNLIR